VEKAKDGKTGLVKLSRSDFALVITDLRMPGISGLDLMREGKKTRPETRWIIITAYGLGILVNQNSHKIPPIN
jgi:YesN/AraC family two-component response regulator